MKIKRENRRKSVKIQYQEQWKGRFEGKSVVGILVATVCSDSEIVGDFLESSVDRSQPVGVTMARNDKFVVILSSRLTEERDKTTAPRKWEAAVNKKSQRKGGSADEVGTDIWKPALSRNQNRTERGLALKTTVASFWENRFLSLSQLWLFWQYESINRNDSWKNSTISIKTLPV